MPAFSPVALNSRDLRGGGGGGGVGRTISSCTSDLPEGSYTANRTTPPQGKKRDCFARVSIITDSDVALYKRQFLLIRNRWGRGSRVTRKRSLFRKNNQKFISSLRMEQDWFPATSVGGQVHGCRPAGLRLVPHGEVLFRMTGPVAGKNAHH